MSINPKDFYNQQDHNNYYIPGIAPISSLIAQNSNHIWDYMITRPKYINPLLTPGYYKYNTRLSFGSEQLLNASIYSSQEFNPVGLDNFSKQLNEKNKAIVQSAIKF